MQYTLIYTHACTLCIHIHTYIHVFIQIYIHNYRDSYKLIINYSLPTRLVAFCLYVYINLESPPIANSESIAEKGLVHCNGHPLLPPTPGSHG